MIYYYLDSSAWVKRYYKEHGSDWVQGLFANDQTFACATLGVIEIFATLARKRKASSLPLK
jgi:predicted nucleic acid-binding protein